MSEAEDKTPWKRWYLALIFVLVLQIAIYVWITFSYST